MAKNVTFSYFDRKRPDHVKIELGNWHVPPNRTPISRLSWHLGEARIKWDEIAKTVATSSLADAVFFVDSSFLGRNEIPPAVWDALLSRKLVFTDGVWRELEDWRNRPFANRDFRDLVVHAKSNGHPSIEFFSEASCLPEYRDSASYYISLLACRKVIGHELCRRFTADNGRKPTNAELKTMLQRSVRDRGFFLAEKGWQDREKPNLLVDEQLVVFAIVNALTTGRETSILTGDRDVLEQFYKALYLLDTHYRSMLVADAYVACPENLIELPTSEIAFSAVFEPPTKVLRTPRRFTDWVLPERWKSVIISCWRMGGHGDQMKMTRFAFNAECEMRSLLEVKGEGRNTSAIGGQNCHILISPPFAEALGGRVAVSTDKVATLGSFTGPLLDLNYSIMEIERFNRYEVVSGEMLSPTPLGLRLATFKLDQRLEFLKPTWRRFTNDDLKTAIRHFDPAAIFFADLSFMSASHDCGFEDALAAKGFATTSHIREAISGCPSANPLSAVAKHAIGVADNVGVYDPSESGFHSGGYGYYLGLLAYRKMFAKVIAHHLALELARQPTDVECLQRVEEISGLPGRRLAEEGIRRNGDTSLFFNEELLVMALLMAIDRGTDAVFLTHDASMEEQFFQLCDSVGNDYAAYCFARSQRESVNAQIGRLSPVTGDGIPRQLYEAGPIYWKLTDGWKDRCLPKRPYPINLNCWRFGEADEHSSAISVSCYRLERPMQRLLTTKAQAGGRNFVGDSGANVRISFAQAGGKQAWVTVARDRTVALGSRNLPCDGRLDLRIDGLPAMDLARMVQMRRVFVAPS